MAYTVHQYYAYMAYLVLRIYGAPYKPYKPYMPYNPYMPYMVHRMRVVVWYTVYAVRNNMVRRAPATIRGKKKQRKWLWGTADYRRGCSL
jgi:hypothetical protein